MPPSQPAVSRSDAFSVKRAHLRDISESASPLSAFIRLNTPHSLCWSHWSPITKLHRASILILVSQIFYVILKGCQRPFLMLTAWWSCVRLRIPESIDTVERMDLCSATLRLSSSFIFAQSHSILFTLRRIHMRFNVTHHVLFRYCGIIFEFFIASSTTFPCSRLSYNGGVIFDVICEL